MSGRRKVISNMLSVPSNINKNQQSPKHKFPIISLCKMKKCETTRKCILLSSLILILLPTKRTLICVTIAINFMNLVTPTTPLLYESKKFLNENSTLLHPLINATHNASVDGEMRDENRLQNLPWWCHCSNELEEVENESECHCTGPKLFQIPQNLQHITRLSIANAKYKVLREAGLRKYSDSLRDIILTNLNDFYLIEPGAFKNTKFLRTIYIAHAPKLQYISPETFKHISSHSFKTLKIIHCGLREIPDMNLLSIGILLQLDFEGNQISEILENALRIKTEQLILDNNALTTIHKAAFNGSEIGKLSLKGNFKLTLLHESAFQGIVNIRELDLSSTSIESMPSENLDKLEILRIQNTQSLKHIPSVYNFKNLEEAWLTHSFHCCAFKFPSRHDPMRHDQQVDLIRSFQKKCQSMRHGDTLNASGEYFASVQKEHFNEDIRKKRSALRWNRSSESHMENRGEFNEADNKSLNSISDYGDIGNAHDEGDIFSEGVFGSEPATVPHESLEALCGNLTLKVKNVKCFPKPDALNPCEDVMGSNWLRASVWIVVSLAVVGNVSVLVVLFSNRSELTVPKFLMCNLAIADFCMGSYLLLIASIDLHSMGEYFNFAFDWQYGIGCKTAGFLTVFASHLSIFTLTIITVERWFAITHAIYLNKRLKFRTSVYVMIGGWVYSMVMASMPLLGISNYSSTSICLPMEAIESVDTIYLITVLALSGLGFFVIAICYAQIYFSLGAETRAQSTSSGEMTVAKKMALLVFTNFACWAPCAFFGLTALAGYPLIDVPKSKILLVFFYPLNSFADPYLYAILTAQYRRDLFLLLSKFGLFTQRAQKYKMNYSNPTHTIPLNVITSARVSNNTKNFYRRSKSTNNSNFNPFGDHLLAPDTDKQENGKNDDGHV